MAVNVALAFTPNTYEMPVWFKQSFLLVAEDVEEAKANNKRVVLFFGQDGCPYCKKLIEVNLNDAKIGNFARENFDVIALNIFGAREVLWVDGNPRPENELAAHLNVRATPTLIFLDEKGNIVERLTGYDPPEEFLCLLKRVRSKE